LITKAIVPFRF